MEAMDSGVVSTVASIIAGFGVAMLFFRIQRELEMQGRDEIIWIPWADWLLIVATLISLIGVLFPLLLLPAFPLIGRFIVAACGASVLLVAGYVLAILAHYRLLWGKCRSGPRDNPEPAERVLVYLSVVVSLLCFAGVICLKGFY